MPVPLFSLNWSLGRSCALNNTGLRGKILGSSGGRTVSRWLLPPWGRLRPRTKFCAIQLFARPSGIQPCPLLCPSRSQPKPHPFPMSSPSQGLPLSAPALLHHPTPPHCPRPQAGTGSFPWSVNQSRVSQVALAVKNPPANAGDAGDKGSVPASGRSPGGGHGNPLQYSCLENPMDRGAWQAIVHGVAKSLT